MLSFSPKAISSVLNLPTRVVKGPLLQTLGRVAGFESLRVRAMPYIMFTLSRSERKRIRSSARCYCEIGSRRSWQSIQCFCTRLYCARGASRLLFVRLYRELIQFYENAID